MGLILPFCPNGGLAYPGRSPGFNPRHIAASGTLFSGVGGFGGNFVNLLNSANGTIAGSPTGVIKGVSGPGVSFLNATDIVKFPFPLTSFAAVTMAAIFMTGTSFSAATMRILGNNVGASSSTGMLLAATTGTPNVTVGGSSQALAGIGALALNTPYFLAVSYNINSTAYGVLVNLLNGSITSGSVSVGAGTSGDGTFVLGNVGNVNRPLLGYISAAMFSSKFMSSNLLLQWAQNPWDFWYPPFQYLSLKTPIAAAAFMAAWALNRNVIIEGVAT